MGRFRIDVVRDQELIEIQHGSLAAIRRKIHQLLADHHVRVVKPIVVQKQLVKRSGKGRRIVTRRQSPKRGSVLDLFQELVYFRDVFPHRALVLEVPLITVEEWRYPGHGRRRWRRRDDHQIEDQKLLTVQAVHIFRTTADLAALVAHGLPTPFRTSDLAQSRQIPIWFARQIAYCLRETGATRVVGRQGNARLYAWIEGSKSKERGRESISGAKKIPDPLLTPIREPDG
jgi:hypothetical protein